MAETTQTDRMKGIAKRFPVVTLCQYDVRHFRGVTILNTLRLHRDNFRYPADRFLG